MFYLAAVGPPERCEHSAVKGANVTEPATGGFIARPNPVMIAHLFYRVNYRRSVRPGVHSQAYTPGHSAGIFGRLSGAAVLR